MSNKIAKNPVREIVSLHNEIMDALRVGLPKAIRIGELLAQEHAKLKHGQWLPWLEKNLPFTDRTARNYIRVYENRERLKSESVSDLGSAYKLLQAPKFDLEVHELGNLFPMMADDELDDLAADIKKNGLIERIVLYEGKILDGKCRYEACRRAGVKPSFRNFEAQQQRGNEHTPMEFLMAVNYHRQSLSPEQKAQYERDIAKLREKERKLKSSL